ncbi:SusC/RagA family TonB-linked outer membrane protein [Emticicia aquatilis]|uniref:SusC/RagA family TonB-linked outer membrane protein n=1 Tax=Emticicia aquatilis TaxID=1537369 RepID=A0A916YMD8_9BACT|nr:TonB-dependent receptor [Emticicia aquatilis]GGD52284.1 SusC/RagA family TonB-linked outer membrane protein [Emticicia aquatilis]
MTKNYRTKQKTMRWSIAALLLLLSPLSLLAQAKLISGKVRDASNNEFLPSVSVTVKGSSRGSIADASGNYKIEASASETLVFSFIGYETQEVLVGSRTNIDVALNVGTGKELNEVVVVGYGTQKKRDITGSVVSVSEATLKEVPAPNILNTLKGRAAGVSIVSNGSTPGSQASIRIRGNRSLTTGNGDGLDGPLVVVDGIPYGGLNDINPDDISNIEILKDASATAIFGSRGAGGVILITTKRGKVGKPVLTYDGYHGVTSIMGKYNVMNGEQYAKFKELSAAYNTQGAGTTAYPLTEEERANLAAGVSTDWQDLLYKQGFNTSHQLGLQGGVENTQYGMGIGYFNETGIMPNQNFDRMNIRATLDQKIGKRVKVGLNTINTMTRRNDPAGGGIPTELVRLSPLVPAYNADGSVNLNPKKGTIEAQAVSPLTLISRGDDILSNERSIRTFNSLYAEVNILDGLKYRFNAGLNFSQVSFNGYGPPNTFVNSGTEQNVSNADVRNTEYWDVNFQHLLYYDKVFAEKHKIGFTALYEVTKNHNLGSSFNVKGVPADYIQTANFSLASGQPTGSGSFGETGLLSYMARLNYTFNSRYTLTATFRRDGSSTLSPGNQYFNYPAIGLSWNIIDEPFMKDLSFLSNLKLRGGWGISGNRNVGAYATLGALSSGYYNFGPTAAGQALAYTVTSLPASNLGWQSTSQSDFGLEIGLFNNRITGSFDVYKQNTKDILLSVNLPQSNGAGSTLKNLGKTQGKGFESTLTFDILRNKGGFNWSADVTYFFNREKITQLTTPSELDNKGNFWFVGQPLTVIYDYNKIGIWQLSDKENGTLGKQTSPVQVPGEIRVEDVDGNGKIDAADRKIIGNFQPKWEGGLTNRFSFKGFDLSIVTYARMGMKVLVPYLSGTSGGGSGFGFLNQGRSNQLVMDYWTETNPTNAFPKPNAGGGVRDFTSTTQYQDGSFIKMRSINLGYTVPTKGLSKIGISSARIYLNATNPFIIYSPLVKAKLAIDPEGNGYGNTIQGGNFNRVISVNLNNPPVRQFTLGVNLKF